MYLQFPSVTWRCYSLLVPIVRSALPHRWSIVLVRQNFDRPISTVYPLNSDWLFALVYVTHTIDHICLAMQLCYPQVRLVYRFLANKLFPWLSVHSFVRPMPALAIQFPHTGVHHHSSITGESENCFHKTNNRWNYLKGNNNFNEYTLHIYIYIYIVNTYFYCLIDVRDNANIWPK